MRHRLEHLDRGRRLHLAVGVRHDARVQAAVRRVRSQQLQAGDAVTLLDAVAIVRSNRCAVLEPLRVNVVTGEGAGQLDGGAEAGRAIGETRIDDRWPHRFACSFRQFVGLSLSRNVDRRWWWLCGPLFQATAVDDFVTLCDNGGEFVGSLFRWFAGRLCWDFV